MKSHMAMSLMGSLALAGLHLSCSGSDDSTWQRPQMTPSGTSWDVRESSYAAAAAPYDSYPSRVPAEQSSYRSPQNDRYTPAGADAFPPLPSEAQARPQPQPPRPGFASGVMPGELPAVTEARKQGRPWKQAAEQFAANLQEPELRADFQKRLDEIVPAVARALMDRPTEDALVTVAVYRESGTGAAPAAAPATQPAKQVAVAVAFEGFGKEPDDTFLPRVLADMPRPTAERRAVAAATTQPTTLPTTQPGEAGLPRVPVPAASAPPATRPALPELALDPEISGYMVFFLGEEGLTAAVVPHREMKRNVVAALTAGPATAGAAGDTQPTTQPTAEQLADRARQELELREREMEQWRNWYDADRERYQRELAERDYYEQQRDAEYEARRQYDRGYDDGRYAASSDYGYGYGYGYYYPAWHHYRWSHYRYCPGWYYGPSLIVTGGYYPYYYPYFYGHKHWHGGHYHHGHHDGHHNQNDHRASNSSGRANRPGVPRPNAALPASNLPTASTGRVPWGAPPPGAASGTLSGSGVLPQNGSARRNGGGNAGRSTAIRTSPRGDGVVADDQPNGSRSAGRNTGRNALRDVSRNASGRVNAAPSSGGDSTPPLHGPQPFDRTPGARARARGDARTGSGAAGGCTAAVRPVAVPDVPLGPARRAGPGGARVAARAVVPAPAGLAGALVYALAFSLTFACGAVTGWRRWRIIRRRLRPQLPARRFRPLPRKRWRWRFFTRQWRRWRRRLLPRRLLLLQFPWLATRIARRVVHLRRSRIPTVRRLS